MAIDSNTRYASGAVKPTVKKKPSTTADTWARAQIGVGAGPLSSREMVNLKKATDVYNQTIAKGETPESTQSFFDTTAKAEKSGYDAAVKALSANAGMGTGAGGSAGPSALDRYTQQLQAMLTGGSYRQPYEQLQSQLQNMYGQAGGQVNTAMDNLGSFLQGQANPYAGVKAQETQVTPALSELLQSQGVSQNPLQQLAAVTQAQNAGQASAFNNLVGSLSGIYGANQAGQIGDVAQQRADLQNQLTSSNLAYGAQIQNQASDQQQKLMTMLLTALSKGGQPKKGKLF